MFKIRKHTLHGKVIPESHIEIRDTMSWTSSSNVDTLIKDLDKNYLNNIINKIKRDEFGVTKTSLLKILEDEQIYRVNHRE